LLTFFSSIERLSSVNALHNVLSRRTGQPPAETKSPYRWEIHVKIKVKKVESIEATRVHLEPDAPQGAV
jgi:hypothetical protein